MSDREELTDEERAVICGAPSLATLGDAGAKVLRIIDACDADRAALVARVAELEAQCAEFEQQAHDWHVRALKLVSAESELTSLREDRAALVEQSALLKRERDEARAKAVAAELAHQQAADEFENQRYELASENVALQSEVEMLRDAGCGRVLLPAEHPSEPDEDALHCMVEHWRESCQRDAELAAEWKATAESYRVELEVARTENAKLTEALAASERSAGRADSERAACLERVGTLQKTEAFQRDKRLAAEARVRELTTLLRDHGIDHE